MNNMSYKHDRDKLSQRLQEILEATEDVLESGSPLDSYAIFPEVFRNRRRLPNGTNLCWKLLRIMNQDLLNQEEDEIGGAFEDYIYVAKRSLDCFGPLVWPWQWKIFVHAMLGAFDAVENINQNEKVVELHWKLYRLLGEKGLKEATIWGHVLRLKNRFV